MTDQSAPGGLIRLDGVTKTCQSGAPPALAQISIGVAAGEVVAVMGPSGCGEAHATDPAAAEEGHHAPDVQTAIPGTDDPAGEDDRRRRARRPGRTRPAMVIRPAGNRDKPAAAVAGGPCPQTNPGYPNRMV